MSFKANSWLSGLVSARLAMFWDTGARTKKSDGTRVNVVCPWVPLWDPYLYVDTQLNHECLNIETETSKSDVFCSPNFSPREFDL